MFNSRSRSQTRSFSCRRPIGVRISAPLRADRKPFSEVKLAKLPQSVSALNLRYHLQTAVVAGVTCFTFVAWIGPAFSQQFQGQNVWSEGDQREQLYLAHATNEHSSPGLDAIAAEAVTGKDIEIPIDELRLLLKPLTLAQLEVEAVAWLGLLQAKVQEISDAEIAIKRKHRQVKQQEEAVKALEEAKGKLEEAEELQKTATKGSPEYEEAAKKVEEAREALEKAQTAVEEVSKAQDQIEADESIKKALKAAEENKQLGEEAREGVQENSEAIADEYDGYYDDYYYETEEAQAAEEAAESLENAAAGLEESQGSDGEPNAEVVREKKEQLEETAEKLEQSKEEEAQIKTQLVVNVTELQQQQTEIVDRFKAVLEELEKKGGEPESYHKYIQAISGIEIDVTDTKDLEVRLVAWIQAEEGGQRWAGNLATFVGIVVASIPISQMLGWSLNSVMKKLRASELIRHFLVGLVKRGGVVIGVLLGLSALEVSLGPIVALLGGASFVLAFALQSNLGNFVSGLMIMFYKPFDVGHRVEVNGVSGKVQSINVASTKIRTFDRKIITIPNNKVWEDNIINKTVSGIRGAILPIRVSLQESTAKVKKILMEIAKSHQLILDKPKTRTFVTEYGEYYVELGLLFYTEEDNYWPVRGDLMESIKERLEQEGIFLAMRTQNVLIQPASENDNSDNENSDNENDSESI